MKSFADWTDEIRDLMNPPKPMVDRCNLQDLYDGSQWGGADLAKLTEMYKQEPLSEWHRTLLRETREQWDKAVGGTKCETTGAELQRIAAICSGRRTGKSRLTQQVMEALADYEEGTFVPTLSFDCADAGEPSKQEYRYTRTGNVVTVEGKA